MRGSFLANSVAVAAVIIASVLLSGKAEINLQHHLNLPAELSNKTSIEITTPRGIFDNPFNAHRVIHIRVSSVFRGLDTVKDIGRVLQEADDNDTVVFHIAGQGGEVDTVMYLINNIKSSRAHTVMIVEGPSYSGHAYLAASGNELHMLPYSFLMYHTSSGYGIDCSKAKGTDRTVSNIEHCYLFLETHLNLVGNYIDSISFLTGDEKYKILTGHDVYITAQEYNKRTGG